MSYVINVCSTTGSGVHHGSNDLIKKILDNDTFTKTLLTIGKACKPLKSLTEINFRMKMTNFFFVIFFLFQPRWHCSNMKKLQYSD